MTFPFNAHNTVEDEAVAAGGFAVDVDKFRFYARGTLAGSTALAAEDINADRATNNWLDEVIQLRLRLQETGGVSGLTTDDYQLQYNHELGGWNNVTATSSVVRFGTAFTDAADGAATAARLTSGTGSFIAGIVEEADGVIENFQLTASNHTDLAFGLELRNGDVVDTDIIQFRLLLNGGTSGITNSVTPQMTVKDLLIDVDAFRFYDEDGGEAASTALAAENTNVTIDSATNPDFQLRIRFQETNGQVGSANTGQDDWRLRISVNGGAFNTMNVVTGIDINSSSALVDGAATTNRLSAGTGSFFAGIQEETSTSATTGSVTFEANNFTEIVWGLSLVDVNLSNNDTLDFNVERLVSGVPEFVGVNQTVTPRITVTT